MSEENNDGGLSEERSVVPDSEYVSRLAKWFIEEGELDHAERWGAGEDHS